MSHAADGAGVPLDPEAADEVARLMHVLSARSRVLILGALRNGPLPVGDLAAAVGMQGSAVSQQLRVLRSWASCLLVPARWITCGSWRPRA